MGSLMHAQYSSSQQSVADPNAKTQNIVGQLITTNSADIDVGAMSKICILDSAVDSTLSLPPAAVAWSINPFGLIIVHQRNAGKPIYAASGSDSLRATSGVQAPVQYGLSGCMVISSTEWALAL